MVRNGWTDYIGISGRFAPESVDGFHRNRWTEWSGLRIGAVHKDRYGFYIAALCKKLKDPGLANPAWACERPEGKFDNYDDAVTHVKGLLFNSRND